MAVGGACLSAALVVLSKFQRNPRLTVLLRVNRNDLSLESPTFAIHQLIFLCSVPWGVPDVTPKFIIVGAGILRLNSMLPSIILSKRPSSHTGFSYACYF